MYQNMLTYITVVLMVLGISGPVSISTDLWGPMKIAYYYTIADT